MWEFSIVVFITVRNVSDGVIFQTTKGINMINAKRTGVLKLIEEITNYKNKTYNNHKFSVSKKTRRV